MMLLDSLGLTVRLRDPWEGAIRRTTAPTAVHRRAAAVGRVVHTPPVLHLTTATLPEPRGDFGSGAVDLLGSDDAFVALLEYGPDSLGSPLFDTGGLPRRLRPLDFAPHGLQRPLPEQSGCQRFCTESGRALCLYVVLGAHWNARRVLPRVNEVLADIEVAAA